MFFGIYFADLAQLDLMIACFVTVCVRVPLESAFAQRFAVNGNAATSLCLRLCYCRPFRLSDQSQLAASATPASPLRFRLRLSSFAFVFAFVVSSSASSARLQVELTELSPLGNRSWRTLRFDWTCPTRTAVCNAQRVQRRQRRLQLRLRRRHEQLVKVKVATAQTATTPINASKRERESTHDCSATATAAAAAAASAAAALQSIAPAVWSVGPRALGARR